MCLHAVVFKWKEAVVISKGRKREIPVQRGCAHT